MRFQMEKEENMREVVTTIEVYRNGDGTWAVHLIHNGPEGKIIYAGTPPAQHRGTEQKALTYALRETALLPK